MAAGREHHHGVQRLLEKRRPIRESAADAVGIANPVHHSSGQVTDRHNLEAVVELPQIMQVHHLCDESATDDADAESSLSQAGRDYTPVVDGRSICRVSPLTPSIAIAGAPVSFGAFEVTVGVDPHVPDALAVLDAVARAGYAGIDLGPPGYLGNGRELSNRLHERGLHLAGGYIAMPFSEPDRMPSALTELGRLLDIFDGVKGDAPMPPRA